jgi:hypothetical protein
MIANAADDEADSTAPSEFLLSSLRSELTETQSKKLPKDYRPTDGSLNRKGMYGALRKMQKLQARDNKLYLLVLKELDRYGSN